MLIIDIIKNRISPIKFADGQIERLGYAIKNFRFSPFENNDIADVQWWEYNRQHFIDRLELIRNRVVQPQPQAQPQAQAVGQIWEPCELCGREPVYMPSHLCEHCLKS